MKKITLLLSLVSLAFSSNGQSSDNLLQFNGYIEAQTTLELSVTVCEERVVRGPYAKYAQQLLAVSAPLNDKKSYSITASSIGSVVEGDVSKIYKLESASQSDAAAPLTGLAPKKEQCNDLVQRNEWSDQLHVEFVDMGINPIVTSSAAGGEIVGMQKEKSFDEMASDAAATIFRLRRRRFDLITGDFGEGVFGEGLKAAIDEMARIEKEYLSLFIGKRYVSYKVYNYTITPQKGKSSYILARFSDQKGVLELTTLEGDPLVLTVTPEGKYDKKPEKKSVAVAPVAPVAPAKKGKVVVEPIEKVVARYQVADNAECKLFNATTLLKSKRVPILQLGTVVEKVEKVYPN